ncbi:MAG TPA: methyltetrahydrofolate cobalamin methyltransferase [Anaerolineae bacterium]|nr:methyltetrahydrofolate cobalamin methyltransferase [Anaerolineae bacterium]HIQ11623.1 methyltetrahydrofolate cobalamin methyltransferase [Caldilineales bacterium]
MPDTIIKSPTKTVIMGPGRPFVIIGERINPSGRKKLAAEMRAGDFSRVREDAIAQVAAGAHILDVNAGLGVANPEEVEPEVLTEAIRQVQEVVDVPICIDSSVIPALKAGLEVAWGKPIVNSVTAEEERMEAILPLVAEKGAAVIALPNDETGISYDPRVRFELAKKIVERAERYGIPREDVIIDPLTMPAGAVPGSAKTLIQVVRMVSEELGCNTTCGASNISFGLPNRKALNATFIAMVIAAGMTSAITNPLEPEIMMTIQAADALMGHDENCAAWIAANKPADAEGEAGRRGRRRTRRSRRER